MSKTSVGGSTEVGFSSMVDLHELWRRKWTVVLCGIVVTAVGVVYVAVTPSVYEVRSRVMVRQDNPSLQASPASLYDREFLATQTEILRSSLIIQGALQRAPISIPVNYERGPTEFVLKSLNVSPIIQTDVLKIVFRGTDPAEARRFTLALVETYQEHVQQVDQGRHTGDLRLLVQSEVDLRRQLDELQEKYVKLRSASPMIGQGRDSLDMAGMRLSSIGQQLSDARNRRIELEDKVEVFDIARDLRPSEPLLRVRPISQMPLLRPAGVAVPPAIPLPVQPGIGAVRDILRDSKAAGASDIDEVQQQLWQARMRSIELSQQFGPKHAEVRSNAQQIEFWEKLLAERTAAAADSVLRELEAVKATESKLEALYATESQRAKALDDYLVEEAALNGKIQRISEIYTRTLVQLKDYQLTDEALHGGRSSVVVRLLDGTELPEELVWPQAKILVALCGVLGLVGGVIVVAMQGGMRRPIAT